MWTQWQTLTLHACANRSSSALNTSHIQHHDRIWLPSTQHVPVVWLHGPNGVEMRNVSERKGSNRYLHLPLRRTLWIDFLWPETQSITNPSVSSATAAKNILFLPLFMNIYARSMLDLIYLFFYVYRNLKSCSLVVVVNEESLKCFSCIMQRH